MKPHSMLGSICAIIVAASLSGCTSDDKLTGNVRVSPSDKDGWHTISGDGYSVSLPEEYAYFDVSLVT